MAEYYVNAIITWTTKDGKTFSTGKTFDFDNFDEAKALYHRASNLPSMKNYFNANIFHRHLIDSFQEQGIDFTLNVALLDEDLMNAFAEVTVSSNLL